jgi:hypothetical protein
MSKSIMPHINTEIANLEAEKLERDDVIKAFNDLNELIELRELLEICLEENADCDGNPQQIRIKLLIDCYLSRSEYCFDELQLILKRFK